MITSALSLLTKDLRLILTRGGGLAQALLLGLLLVFLFSLSLDTGERLSPQGAATMFWLASAFCQVLIFNMLYAVEETNGARLGLLLLPGPVQSIWLGKAMGGFVLLVLAQLLFVPATIVFLNQSPGPAWPAIIAAILAADLGMAASGSLLGALSVGQSGRESLLSIILFPLLIPLLLAAIRLMAMGLSSSATGGMGEWLGVALAFDALFMAAGLVLFPFMYTGED